MNQLNFIYARLENNYRTAGIFQGPTASWAWLWPALTCRSTTKWLTKSEKQPDTGKYYIYRYIDRYIYIHSRIEPPQHPHHCPVARSSWILEEGKPCDAKAPSITKEMALNALLACLAMVEAAGMAGMARKKKTQSDWRKKYHICFRDFGLSKS